MTHDLDTFEAQLLSELRTTVVHRCDTGVPAPRSRRRWIMVAAATISIVVAAAPVVPGVLGTPAYAVQDGSAGIVEVHVERLEDAAGLQAALIDHGVPADVTYLGHDLTCAPGRYLEAPSVVHSATRVTIGTGISVKIDLRSVAHGETLVLVAARIDNGISGEFGFAAGPVQDCRAVPLHRDQH